MGLHFHDKSTLLCDTFIVIAVNYGGYNIYLQLKTAYR